jgi:hypothetical protein
MVKESVVLTITSLLSIVLFTVHFTDDTIRGMSGGGLENLFGILILVVFLCGTLLLSERRSGYIITLLGSLFALAMPIIHMRGRGVGGAFAQTSGAFLFIWTIWALGLTGALGIILSVRGLLRRRAPVPEVRP